jgi:hypothetical protein
VVDALHAATGQTLRQSLWRGHVRGDDAARQRSPPSSRSANRRSGDARNALLQDAAIGQDAIPDPDAVDRQIGEQGEALRQRAGALVGTGNGLAAFAGGATAATPVNIGGLFIPPARAVFGATASGPRLPGDGWPGGRLPGRRPKARSRRRARGWT